MLCFWIVFICSIMFLPYIFSCLNVCSRRSEKLCFQLLLISPLTGSLWTTIFQTVSRYSNYSLVLIWVKSQSHFLLNGNALNLFYSLCNCILRTYALLGSPFSFNCMHTGMNPKQTVLVPFSQPVFPLK